MKKLLALMLVLVLVAASFTACASRDDTDTDDEVSGEEGALGDANSSDDWNNERPSLEEALAHNETIDPDDITLIQFEDPADDNPVAIVVTSMGEIYIALYPNIAPKAVENFTTLANDGFYDGKTFHYVREGYVVWGGAVHSNGVGSSSIFKDANGDQEFIAPELSGNVWHFRGAVTLAVNNEGYGGSQFAIVQSEEIFDYDESDLAAVGFPQKVIDKYKEVGGTPHRDGVNTVFGMVYDGIDVVDEMTWVPVDASFFPEEEITIEQIIITTYGETGEFEIGGSSSADDEADDGAGDDEQE